VSIAADLILIGDYDIAVRDINMALAAYAMARSEGSRQQRRELKEFAEDVQLEAVA
jgi:hypothetical protein